MAGRKRVFDSVFPLASFKAIPPTPSSTPTQGFTAPGQSFGGPNFPPSPYKEDASSSSEQVTWDRAWHTATSFLALPKEAAPKELAADGSSQSKRWFKSPTREEVDALYYLLAPSSRGRAIRKDAPGQSLVEWFTNEVREHFLEHTRPKVVHDLRLGPEEETLRKVLSELKDALRVYSDRFNYLCGHIDENERVSVSTRFRQNIHTAISHSLPAKRSQHLIRHFIQREVRTILGFDDLCVDSKDQNEEDEPMGGKFTTAYEAWRKVQSSDDDDNENVKAARTRLMHFIVAIQEVGLGGKKAQVLLANIMDESMTEFVKVAYSRHWEAPSSVVSHLRLWIENRFSRLAAQSLNWFNSADQPSFSRSPGVDFSHVKGWQESAMARLGNLRITELFDIVVEWDDSAGAIEDLKQYVVTPSSRSYLTASFASVIFQRLLQPGASTLQILQVYISIIRAFKLLDPKGVLLDRVTRAVRRYLRDRDDTVKVIVGGLLADTDESDPQSVDPGSETLAELAVELNKASKAMNQEDDGELDWDDMNWIPDPVDAAPDYKKSRNSDVIGSLISLFESKDVFVKEFQSVMAQRLLRSTFDFENEIRVLELLKMRFGDPALQECEVMLKDVLDSRRVDASIRQDQALGLMEEESGDTSISDDLANKMHLTAPGSALPQMHAKILSRLFWPNLEESSFNVPAEISGLQERYAKGFESLKQSRKLTWLNALGSVTVELDLEDRVFNDDVLPYQATVIHAFQSLPDASASAPPVSRDVASLATQLSMDDSLVLSACHFWASKRILEPTSSKTFRVLETLPDADTQTDDSSHHATAPSITSASSAAAAAAEEAARVAAAQAAQDQVNEKMKVYWQFIVGMLTNQGPMNLQRIIMTLKLAVPGGFEYSAEELREFLGGMMRDGKVDLVAGGNYKIIK